jgi:hypothetical protein
MARALLTEVVLYIYIYIWDPLLGFLFLEKMQELWADYKKHLSYFLSPASKGGGFLP